MNKIKFNGEGVILQEEIEAFGQRRTEELSIEYSEHGDFEIELDTGGFVSLESLVDVDFGDDGNIESLTLEFEELPSVQTAIRQNSESGGELPPVPDVDVSEIDVGGRRSFYERMRNSPDSQPGEIRQLIHEHQELDREEFDRLVDEELGYASDGGGTSMSLVVLENITEEIERHGRGDDQRIVWTG
ncbi:hypothetical protein [Natrarchaeobaculum aegyptiacum]|uniref:Uncharacterized protein n=1 Tax=Natrarchaeobaculum aegyptiacum TaxID=745377 RepID=A0A2Z2HUY5_9EURY|nr:hypothetical protein [Natrarchaeobaculum aegyptiacum]ARS89337.1 hypothetical protein B1756_05970 [Natrarchaeobaculum aegyptiacum]